MVGSAIERKWEERSAKFRDRWRALRFKAKGNKRIEKQKKR